MRKKNPKITVLRIREQNAVKIDTKQLVKVKSSSRSVISGAQVFSLYYFARSIVTGKSFTHLFTNFYQCYPSYSQTFLFIRTDHYHITIYKCASCLIKKNQILAFEGGVISLGHPASKILVFLTILWKCLKKIVHQTCCHILTQLEQKITFTAKSADAHLFQKVLKSSKN